MSQRWSEYAREERDLYETPEWVTNCVIDYIDVARHIWEPACGSGKMVRALMKNNLRVTGTDINSGNDFLSFSLLPDSDIEAIVTNPPYNLAQEFIEHALSLMAPKGTVAMLLRTDFDHAKTRQHLFGKCPDFWAKVVLTKRIKWFEDSKGQPSFNHAWFVWQLDNQETPTLWYAP